MGVRDGNPWKPTLRPSVLSTPIPESVKQEDSHKGDEANQVCDDPSSTKHHCQLDTSTWKPKLPSRSVPRVWAPKACRISHKSHTGSEISFGIESGKLIKYVNGSKKVGPCDESGVVTKLLCKVGDRSDGEQMIVMDQHKYGGSYPLDFIAKLKKMADSVGVPNNLPFGMPFQVASQASHSLQKVVGHLDRFQGVECIPDQPMTLTVKVPRHGGVVLRVERNYCAAKDGADDCRNLCEFLFEEDVGGTDDNRATGKAVARSHRVWSPVKTEPCEDANGCATRSKDENLDLLSQIEINEQPMLEPPCKADSIICNDVSKETAEIEKEFSCERDASVFNGVPEEVDEEKIAISTQHFDMSAWDSDSDEENFFPDEVTSNRHEK